MATTGDIRLVWSNLEGGGDVAIAENDLARDDGLETAVLLSLFCDRRAPAGERLPRGQTSARGWFGDEFAEVPGDQTGSHLWLLEGASWSESTARRAEQYARESLQWMLDDRLAERVEATASLPDEGVLELVIRIQRPSAPAATYRYGLSWAAQGVT